MSVIYIVEDEPNVKEVEEIALKSAGFKCKCFLCAKTFFIALKEETPSLLLLDLELPDMDGMQILRDLRKDVRYRDLPIILVTGRTSEFDRVRGLDTGADDYLTKPFSVMELVSRVKALLRRAERDYIAKKQLVIGSVSLNYDNRIVEVEGKECDLTFKEFELLRLLMENKGVPLNREYLLHSVWGVDYEGETRTLDTHITSLRRKLGDSGEMIRTVRSVGYMVK